MLSSVPASQGPKSTSNYATPSSFYVLFYPLSINESIRSPFRDKSFFRLCDLKGLLTQGTQLNLT